MKRETLIGQLYGIRDAVRQAGQIAVKHRHIATWSDKSEKDLVSDVDIGIERFLVDKLQQLCGEAQYVGEETSNHSDDRGRPDGWIIDPLDGTINYYHGSPFYSVSVAYAWESRIEAGFVYDPTRDEMYWAVRNVGAFLNQERIRVSAPADMISRSLGAMSSGGLPIRDLGGLLRLADDSRSFRRFGSTALSLAYVAAGRLDYFVSVGVNIWDIAAGLVLVEEAGGVTTGRGGRRRNRCQYDVAANSGDTLSTILGYLDEESSGLYSPSIGSQREGDK